MKCVDDFNHVMNHVETAATRLGTPVTSLDERYVRNWIFNSDRIRFRDGVRFFTKDESTGKEDIEGDICFGSIKSGSYTKQTIIDPPEFTSTAKSFLSIFHALEDPRLSEGEMLALCILHLLPLSVIL